MEAEFVRYTVDDGVALIAIDRTMAANAQNPQMLKELDEAWTLSDREPEVGIVVLRSEGNHFSAGHDMQGGGDASLGPQRVDGALTVDTYFDWEEPCDLIIAADNAQFSDRVGLIGMPGVEFFAHPWEFGPRRAKQILFTASSLSAEQARECGMVNEVVPLDTLQERAEPGCRGCCNGPVGSAAREARGQQRRGCDGVLADHLDQLRHPSPRSCPRHRPDQRDDIGNGRSGCHEGPCDMTSRLRWHRACGDVMAVSSDSAL